LELFELLLFFFRKQKNVDTNIFSSGRYSSCSGQDFLFRWGRVNNNWESAPPKADIAPNFGATPRQNHDQLRGPHHSLHIGLALALKTRPLSTKSGNIMISGNIRIWGIDINGSW
jgi:hypothetical protein